MKEVNKKKTMKVFAQKTSKYFGINLNSNRRRVATVSCRSKLKRFSFLLT